jgi:hypothetical protein
MGTRLSLRPLSQEGIADRKTSGATRREIALSYPAAGRIHRKQRASEYRHFPALLAAVATADRFSQRARTDNLPSFHHGFY